MSVYHFWYKTTVSAKNLEKAIKMEKKIKPVLSQIQHEEDVPVDTHAIGFQVKTESDDWED